MDKHLLKWTCILIALSIMTNTALAQHTFHRTVTVDPSGNADETKIHEAIASIGINPSEKWTVLVYAGTYTIDTVAKLIVLDDEHENVDIVGVDGEAVIIDVTIGDSMTPRSGIKITSGDETERNNMIRNLTIKTKFGHGIEIVKGGTPTPKNITIDGVTILAKGDGSNGIACAAADTVNITNCTIESDVDVGIVVGDNFTINSTIVRAKINTKTALECINKSGLTITNSQIGVEAPDTTESKRSKRGILIDGGSDVQVFSSTIRGVEEGVRLDEPGDNILFQSCTIVGEGNPSDPGSQVTAIFAGSNNVNMTVPPVFHGCVIKVKAGASTEIACCVEIDKTEGIEFVHCYIRAFSRNEQADVLGIAAPTAHVNIIQCAFNELAKRSTGNVNIAKN